MSDNYLRFQYTFHFSAGSVPPPFHYEYDISLSDQGGMLEYWNDYRSPGLESKKFFFKLDRDKTTALRSQINTIGFRNWEKPENTSLGGEMEWVEGEDGFIIPAELKPEDLQLAATLYEKIKDLVPKGIWKEISQRETTSESF